MAEAASAPHVDRSGTIRVRFWGVRGSIPTPGPDTVRYGGNTSCVTVEGPDGELFILDAGSGIRRLGIALMQSKRLPVKAHLLLTHTHWDHIQGFPFFVPAFIPGNRISIYGVTGTDHSLHDVLAGQMLHQYFPVSLDKLGAELHIVNVKPGRHDIGGATVLIENLRHTGPTVGYRLELGGRSIAYVTDVEPDGSPGALAPSEAVLRLAEGADVLIHDAQYTEAEYPSKVGWGHSPIMFVVKVALAAGARQLFLFHHDPARTDDELDAIVTEARAVAQAAGSPMRVDAAAEGAEVALAVTGALPDAWRAPGGAKAPVKRGTKRLIVQSATG